MGLRVRSTCERWIRTEHSRSAMPMCRQVLARPFVAVVHDSLRAHHDSVRTAHPWGEKGNRDEALPSRHPFDYVKRASREWMDADLRALIVDCAPPRHREFALYDN